MNSSIRLVCIGGRGMSLPSCKPNNIFSKIDLYDPDCVCSFLLSKHVGMAIMYRCKTFSKFEGFWLVLQDIDPPTFQHRYFASFSFCSKGCPPLIASIQSQ